MRCRIAPSSQAHRIDADPRARGATRALARARARARAMLLALLASVASCQLLTPVPDGATVLADIRYAGTESLEAQRFDLYRPAGPGPHPVLIFVHGGRWSSGGRRAAFGVYERLGRRLVDQGVIVAIPSYRLAPHKHPASIEDLARMVALVHRRANQWGGDPNRLFLMGHSSGAQLSLLMATDPRWLAAHDLTPTVFRGVFGLSGPYDLVELGATEDARADVIAAFGDDPNDWAAATPASHLGEAALPPVLLAVGEDDYPFLLRQALIFRRQLEDAGAAVTLFDAMNRDHIGVIIKAGSPQDALTERILARVFSTNTTTTAPLATRKATTGPGPTAPR